MVGTVIISLALLLPTAASLDISIARHELPLISRTQNFLHILRVQLCLPSGNKWQPVNAT